MKPILFAALMLGQCMTPALASNCPPERPPLTPLEGYVIDVCLERDGEARRRCIEEARANQRRCGNPYCDGTR